MSRQKSAVTTALSSSFLRAYPSFPICSVVVIYDRFTPKHTFHLLHWSHCVLPPSLSALLSGQRLAVCFGSDRSLLLYLCLCRLQILLLHKTSRALFFFIAVEWHNGAGMKLPVPGCLCRFSPVGSRLLLLARWVMGVHWKCVCLCWKVEDVLIHYIYIYVSTGCINDD